MRRCPGPSCGSGSTRPRETRSKSAAEPCQNETLLTRTFLHVPGIGAETERSLWAQGCLSWDAFLAKKGQFKLGTASRALACREVEASRAALAEGCHQYFQSALGLRESWRAWPDFAGRCAYLDIETDGGMSGSAVTMIGLYGDDEFQCFVQGDNLESFRDAISRYSMIVTFFGAGFDVPMLKKRFPDVVFDHVHLDLCLAFRRLGMRGGLKAIERRLGLQRSQETAGLDGRDAIRLWRAYQRGSDEALRVLTAYNREDVVNLERLAEIAYDRLRRHVEAGL